MTSRADKVRVWPSAAALEQGLYRALQQSPRGFLAEPHYYTWDNFLPAVLSQAPLPSGWQTLLPMAGPMLVRQIIAENLDHPQWSVYIGQSYGRRLPRRLWRLLVEIKSAGLSAENLTGMKSPRIRSLGLLLSQYTKRLKELSLLDQADCLAILEHEINQGHRPGLLAHWQEVKAGDVLWLRSMDLRLLRALGSIMPVDLEFALSPPLGDPKGVFKLLEATARVLEGDRKERIGIQWRDEADKGLGRLVEAMLAGKAASTPFTAGPEVELLLAPGRYAEVSSLMEKALELMEQGEAAGDIVIAFPDLEIYGQMCLDLAKRTGLPLELDQGRGLASTPLVNWFISLLELPSAHFKRRELAKVLSSPFCALLPFAGRGKHIGGYWPAENLERRLRESGYIDSRELLPDEKSPGGTENGTRGRPKISSIHEMTAKIARFTHNLYAQNDLKLFLEAVSSLLGGLEPRALASMEPGREKRGGSRSPELGRAAVYDLLAHKEMVRCVDEALRAARQVEASEPVSFRRGMAFFKDALSQARSPRGRAPLKGVKVTSIDQASGLRAGYILVGGLAQGEFPRRPAGGDLLTGRDRMELGWQAGLPVWRTDEEEYGGQLLGLALVMGQAAKSLTLSAPGADSAGTPKEPIHIFKELPNYLNIKINKMHGGAFGGQHDLALARDSQGLWAGLSLQFCNPLKYRAIEDFDLGRAALYELCVRESPRETWLDIFRRVREENTRLDLDDLSPDERREQTGPFSGRLSGQQSLDLLDRVLSQPAMRKLSPSSLESLAACPAAWFWTRLMGLGAVPVPEWDLERREEGDWVHAALRLFFQPGEFQESPPPDLAAEINDCLTKARESLIEKGAAAHGTAWDARQGVLAVSLASLARNEYRDMEGMRPHAVESSFGGDDHEFRLDLLSRPGQSINLIGRVDRIDLGPGQVRITDYKHSTNAANLRKMTKPELFGHTAFQLPVYLAAAQHLLGGDYRGQRLNARILPTILLGIAPPCAKMEPDDPFLAQETEIRTQALRGGQANLFNAIEALWLGLLKGNFSPYPQKENCDRCEVRQVCRANLSPGAGQPEEADS